MTFILFCFPPKQRRNKNLYFRTQQLYNSLKKEFQVDIITALAKSGSSRDKKFSFKKIALFWLELPNILKKIKKADIIIIFPSTIWYFWMLLGKIFGKKIVIDHYTTVISPLENVKIPRFLKKIIYVLDKFFYQKIDLVITHTKTMRKQLADFYCLKKNKILVVYSLVDTKLFNPSTTTERHLKKLQKKLNLPIDKKILLYHGEYHSFHAIPIIKKIAMLSRKRKKNYIFVFVGGKAEKKSNMYFLDYVEFKKLPQIILLAELWLGRFSNTDLAKRTASSCMMQAMAMKVPVITFATEENSFIIKDCQNGFLVNTLRPEKILAKIEKIMKDDELLKKVGNEARKTILARFSLKEWQNVNLALKRL